MNNINLFGFCFLVLCGAATANESLDGVDTSYRTAEILNCKNQKNEIANDTDNVASKKN